MILDKIVEDKKIRLKEHKQKVSPEEIRKQAEAVLSEEHRFYHALKKEGISIIGEFKQASPSLGKIDSPMDFKERIAAYSASADAISCLAEEDHFLGNLEDLKQIRTMSPLPILQKDFMIEEYQFYEAKAAGAAAVLLIAAILDDKTMKMFYQLAEELKLDALVEVHDENELERALKIDAKIIGVNNRDLRDFTIRLETTGRLSALVPKEKVLVAESGVREDKDVRFLKECGVDAFLIGQALMESPDPKELAKRWKQL